MLVLLNLCPKSNINCILCNSSCHCVKNLAEITVPLPYSGNHQKGKYIKSEDASILPLTKPAWSTSRSPTHYQPKELQNISATKQGNASTQCWNQAMQHLLLSDCCNKNTIKAYIDSCCRLSIYILAFTPPHRTNLSGTTMLCPVCFWYSVFQR